MEPDTPDPPHGAATAGSALAGKAALVTGAARRVGAGIARSLHAAGADVLLHYRSSADDAAALAAELNGVRPRSAALAECDLLETARLPELVAGATRAFGGLDILVNNAAFQRTHESIWDFSAAEIDETFRTNIQSMFHLAKAAAPRMKPGASIINTTSIQADKPSPSLLAYATTKGAIANFTAGLAQLLAKDGIRVNAVAPGPVWTPLIPSTMAAEKVSNFGADSPFGRPAQPAELAPAYVFLASNEASYISGAVLPVTGGKPFL